MNNYIDNFKKRLIYRSQYRGTKEMDRLVGSFVKKHIDEFSENDCTCPVCRVMNNIYTRWENWTPNTLFEKTIKKHIDKI